MLVNIFLIALAATPLVAAHGKVSVVVSLICWYILQGMTNVFQTGDAGGNTTALGIQGGVVPGAGSNSKTEVDTTVFNSVKAATNGLGKTTGGGQNTLAGMSAVVAQSGSTLPQVSSSGGTLSGTLHVVTTDGAGPFTGTNSSFTTSMEDTLGLTDYTAIVDPTGTGKFATGTQADVTTQVPGKNGNILPNGKVIRTVSRLFARMGLAKRAANVNKDFVSARSLLVYVPHQLTMLYSLLQSQSLLEPPALALQGDNQASVSLSSPTPIPRGPLVVSSRCKLQAAPPLLKKFPSSTHISSY
jgi:hypothetical protein